MGQQVNVTCPDDLVAALDRVAAARRMARPELVRAIMLEAVEAHDAGRLASRPGLLSARCRRGGC